MCIFNQIPMIFKNRPIIKFLTFIFLFGNVILGFALFKSHQNHKQTEQLVKQTQDVLYQSGNILAQGIEIETTARGYVITKDSTLLKTLYTSEKTVFENIGQLRQVIMNKPAQVARVDSVSLFMQKRLNCSLQMVNLRNKEGLTAAIEYSIHERGNNYSEKLRLLIFEIQQEENRLLKQREEANNYSVLVFNWLSVVTLIFMILSTILLRIATLKYLHQNDEIEKRAKELEIANIELRYQKEEKVKRAFELIDANKELLFQNEEKGKRADELLVANEDLVIQNEHKEKRQIQLLITNLELIFQNEEKEKRAAELIVANKELVFQNGEKEKRAVELIIARKAAEESDNLKSAFINTLSHEVRTPMNQILGFANFLNDPQLSDDNRDEYLGIIKDQCYQLLHIINDIVEISRLTTGLVELHVSTYNLVQMVDELVISLKPAAEERNLKISLNTNIKSPDALIHGDKVKLNSILTNLINNAIKFTESGSIEIEYHLAGKWLRFEVKDTGIGIGEDEKHLIFNYFRQIDYKLTRKYEGLGLGLAISVAYAQLMSGEIRVKSKPGKGSTFLVDIPFIPELVNN